MEEQQEEKIKRLLETFFKATQIEALYFDLQMNAISCHYRRYISEDFPRLSMGRIESFLKENFEKESDINKSLYTYYLNHNLVCNISVLSNGAKCLGAVVTQPVALNPLKKSDIETKLDSFTHSAAERDEYMSALQRVPVISYDRITPMGEVLNTLSRSVFEDAGFHQVFCGGEATPAEYQFFQPGKPLNGTSKQQFANRHGGYPIYLKMKDFITKGDAGALLNALDTLDSGSIHLDQLTSKDVLRSLKNSFIEGFAMCCFITIEAGVPYNKARDLTEEFIATLEDIENISDMYKLMKSALLAFTRLVGVTRITGYSKPVRLVMEYIETHYAEKITLTMLAQHVNLSEFYLSNLIKKETGTNIADIINKNRIEESKKILLKSTVSIAELASMVGYTYSNHFSRVFRQYTGTTPSGFIKTIAASSKEDSESKNILHMLSDQLGHAMSLFPGIFDIGRIVNPALNIAWILQPSGEMIEATCYDFWNRKQSCPKCISHMTLEQGRPFAKLDQGEGSPFFVFTAPVTLNGKKYVVELLKGVSDNYFDCMKTSL